MLRFMPRDAQMPTPSQLTSLRPYGGVLAQLLHARGIRSVTEAETFLAPSSYPLHDPFLMKGMTEALGLLDEAKKRDMKAVVYGDYDVDGMCACALLTDALMRYGINATPHVPLREEGYGLNENAVRKLAEEYELLITVDLGITNHQEVKIAQELGMIVIVTDHHQPGLTPCPADVVLNPLLGGYPFPKLCGTGVAFKLTQALLGKVEAEDYLDLVALATVADIVPLVGENRPLVAKGLQRISSRERPGLRALLKVSGSPERVESDTLGFQLGPRLNAAGRLADAAQGVRLLMTCDESEAESIAAELDALNKHRRQMEAEVMEQAQAQVKTYDFVENRALIVSGEGWHAGVVGLVAGRLCQRYGCPTAAFSQEDGVVHGSLRSIPGINIHRCLQACDDLMIRYGGHEQAAGCTLSVENFDSFCLRFIETVRQEAEPEAFVPVQEYDVPLSFAQATDALMRELALLAPFGMANPAPLFLGEGLTLEKRRACGTGGAHLQLTLREKDYVLDGIAFGMGKEARNLPSKVDAVFSLKQDTFRGITRLKCEVKALRAAKGAQFLHLQQEEQGRYENALLDALLQQDGAWMAQEEKEASKAGDRGDESEVIRVADVTLFPPPAQGVLYVARTRQSAQELLKRIGEDAVEVCWDVAEDPLCFPTLLMLPLFEEVQGHWRQVCLLDGEAFTNEAVGWQARLTQAKVWVPAVSNALQELAIAVDAGDEAYRRLYKALRTHAFSSLTGLAAATELSPSMCRTGLEAFRQLQLVEYTQSPFAYAMTPPLPCKLEDSPLLGTLRTMHKTEQ